MNLELNDEEILDGACSLAEVAQTLKSMATVSNPEKPEGTVLGIDGKRVTLAE